MPVAKKENFQSRDPLWIIIISVILASVLMVYPVSYEMSAWRPAFMLLVMFFWVMCQPAWCGVWFALILGAFTDLLMEMPLGANAMCFVLIAFFARYFTREKRIMTESNLWIIFGLAVLFYLVFMWAVLLLSDESVLIMRHWKPFISTVLSWPIVYFGLKKWRAV